jgi:hypothetical protein
MATAVPEQFSGEQKDYSHYIFVYCDEHDQGAVSIFNDDEYLDITLTSRESCYRAGVFGNVINMCGCDPPPYCKSMWLIYGSPPYCKSRWRICGHLEYKKETQELLCNDTVQTNFDRECGGWKFEYFQHNLYTSQGVIEKNKIPSVVRKFLSHLDLPLVQNIKIKQD